MQENTPPHDALRPPSLSPNDPLLDPPSQRSGFQMLRKLLHPGNSYAITIPTKWVKQHVNLRLPYVLTIPNPDGSITLRAYDPQKPIAGK